MVGSGRWRTLARLLGFVVFCLVASGEVHGQEPAETLAEVLSDRIDGAQPSREQFQQANDRRADVMGAVGDSFRLLTMQHGLRIALQSKTRRDLSGPLLKQDGASVRMPRTWNDGDGWLVNYVGHPSQGAASGWIYSEASIGNVGLDPKTVGWTDYVTTPLGGVALIIAEDAIDQHLVTRLERRTGNATLRAPYRSVMTPKRAMANVASGRWHRPTRGLDELWNRSRYGKANATTASEIPRENLPPPPAAITTY